MKNLILSFFVVLISCNKEDITKQISVESRIVVEGSIEEGGFAKVLLSRSVPIGVAVDSTTILNYVIRSAKVTVSDGEKEEVLRVKSDNNTIPPFVYFGSQIKGETGKTYSLKIEYLNRIITAKTTIPFSVPILSADYIKDNPTDKKGNILIKFNDPINEKNFYQVQTLLIEKDSIYIPAIYGNLNDANFVDPAISFQILRGKTFSFEDYSGYKPYFEDGDVISVKLRTMNKAGFDFWNDWQNEIINGQSPIFPNTTSLRSNIEGGIGIWEGYGQKTILVNTPYY
jgi:hypothetical protein